MKKISILLIALVAMYAVQAQIPDCDGLSDTLISITKGTFIGGHDIRCHGMDSGFINLNVWGGAEPYEFLWE